MSKLIKNILASLVVVSTLSFTFTACGSSDNNKTTQEEQTTTESSGDRNVSGNRKPQVNGVGQDSSSGQNIYKDGEEVTLADGSKIKYSSSGDHQILERGEGKIIVFKTVTDEELKSLTPEQKSLVERQMKSDPNGFALIY